jgi:uncharacterized protein YmfQ (DUF2313 family)
MSNIFLIAGQGFSKSNDGISWSFGGSIFGANAVAAICEGNGTIVAVGGTSDIGGLISTSTDNGATWTERDGSWSPEGINAVIFAGGFFVAAASGGYLATSGDGGITWTPRINADVFSFYDLDSLAFGDGVYLVGGNNGSLGTSPDGATWTPRTSQFTATESPPTLDHVYAATFGNGIFVIAGGGGQISRSTDNGATWTLQTSPFGGSRIAALTFGNGLFVATGAGGKVASSPDGATWTPQTSGLTGIISAAANGNGLFFIGSSIPGGQLATSPDGATWTARTSGFGANEILAAFAFPLPVFAPPAFWHPDFDSELPKWQGMPTAVAVVQLPEPGVFFGGRGQVPTKFWRWDFDDQLPKWQGAPLKSAVVRLPEPGEFFGSIGDVPTKFWRWDFDDQLPKWQGAPLEAASMRLPPPLRIAANIFLIAGQGFSKSNDGISWSFGGSIFGANAVAAICEGNGTIVAVGGTSDIGGLISTSTDNGATWTERDGSWSPEGINAVIFAGGFFVAAASGGYLATSGDGGITWTPRINADVFSFYDLDSLAFGDGVYLVGGNNGSLGTSPDGATWTPRTSQFTATESPPTLDHVYAATFGNGIFVIAGGGGQISRSTDNGATWTLQTSPFGGSRIAALTFGNGLFVATGAGGKVASSPDGATWTPQTSGLTGIISAAANGNGLFFIGSSIPGGQLATSPDGATWTARTSGFGANEILAAFAFVAEIAPPAFLRQWRYDYLVEYPQWHGVPINPAALVATLELPPGSGTPPPVSPLEARGDQWVQRTGAEYAQAWAGLLPTGPAWPREPDHVLQVVLAGLAQIWGDEVEVLAARLLVNESDPRQTVILLPDWEKAWGLPDACLAEPLTVADRQKTLVAKMTMLGAQSRAFMTAQAAREGYTIAIKEYAPFMCGVSRCGDTSAQNPDNDGSPRWQIGAPEMRFYWTTSIGQARLSWFRASSGQAGVDPMLRIGIATDLDCMLTRIKPAHTQIVFDYSGLVSGGPFAGTP